MCLSCETKLIMKKKKKTLTTSPTLYHVLYVSLCHCPPKPFIHRVSDVTQRIFRLFDLLAVDRVFRLSDLLSGDRVKRFP